MSGSGYFDCQGHNSPNFGLIFKILVAKHISVSRPETSEIVSELLAHGADVIIYDVEGKTALQCQWAEERNNADVVSILKDYNRYR